MRIAVAQVVQESCTFTPIPTTLASFERFGLAEGEPVLAMAEGVGALGGFLTGIADREDRRLDLEVEPLLTASAIAGGPLTRETLTELERRLVWTLRRALPLDALYLSLHGACVSGSEPDVDGHLLEVARGVVGPSVPIVVSLDHHANITARMMAHLDSVVGHRTQPHDTFETGRLAAEQVVAILGGSLTPTVAWRKLPMITHQERFATDIGPMREWFEQARAAETRPGVAAVSPFPMQPWLDVPEAGWSTVVVTNDDPALAERLAEAHALAAWASRARFLDRSAIPAEAALEQALAAPPGPVLLSDTGDSVLGGAPGDSPYILRALLRGGVRERVLLPIVDPAAVERTCAAGLGATVTLPVGGALATRFHEPVTVTGVVSAIREGPIAEAVVGMPSFDMGRTVRLEVGAIGIVLSEQPGVGGIHPIVYRAVGAEPADARLVVVKTAANFQYFDGLATGVVRVDTPGPTTSRLDHLPWERIPRPMYPLDPDARYPLEAPTHDHHGAERP